MPRENCHVRFGSRLPCERLFFQRARLLTQVEVITYVRRYMAADGVFRANTCRLLVVRQELLLRAFGGKRCVPLWCPHPLAREKASKTDVPILSWHTPHNASLAP